MVLQDKILTYISLFSSAGVGCYGFKEAGFECIATNEILEKRLKIQKLNHKCKYESGYILGDIKDKNIKNQIFTQIDFYKKLGNDRVDVLIATPPCQGMSVANHKKSNNEIERNSLVVESVELIKEIKPRFFILENVASFYKTGCVDKNGNILSIGDMIEQNLHKEYSIYNEVLNLKNYGSNSSRTRTLVIGVCKELKNLIAPFELFPKYSKEKTLRQVISHLKSLEWGEYDTKDFYHSFRIYPANMREWIKDLKEGQSAFDNKEICKRPHKIENGMIIENANKNGDKYTRQKWDSVAPCIHTRNDQMASQNTIHPQDDRVFSIRELMNMMNIPHSFKWLPFELEYLNSLSNDEKIKISKQNEMNIRQSIGEAVPTIIFKQIADKIKDFMNLKRLDNKKMKEIVVKNKLQNLNNIITFIKENKRFFSQATLANIAEISNTQRINNSAYFTNKFILNEIAKTLPNFEKDSIDILEPSAGCGNFLPVIFKKYENIKQVNLKIIDIDSNNLEILKTIYKNRVPDNFKIEFVCVDFLNFNCDNFDLIIGNPPFTKINGKNLAFLFLEKSLEVANMVSMIMPKNLLNTKEYERLRTKLENKGVKHILDFGELGFNGVLIETINITTGNDKTIQVKSLPMGFNKIQNKTYIFDKNLPYWVIYRDSFFDNVLNNLECGIFESFRDRQLTKSNTSTIKDDIKIIKSRNISSDGKIIEIQGYDSYISKHRVSLFKIIDFLDRDDVYLTPNMTYNPRIIKKEKGYIVNGSVAILIPKKAINLTKEQQNYIASNEFRDFYKIARNYQTRTLNIDSTSCFWFGAKKETK